jgi:hypothetical protein
MYCPQQSDCTIVLFHLHPHLATKGRQIPYLSGGRWAADQVAVHTRKHTGGEHPAIL